MIAARLLPVRRRAEDQLIVEEQKLLDRRGYRIERSLALSRGKPNLEDTILARQRYGLSELGILPTQSRDSDSVWLKLGSAGFEHKIIDGVLWIRSPSAMLGYLNAPSPFDADGWFNTQDLVETDGEYIRIFGRKSELINVAGEKVHPTEIENVLLQLENVKDVTVYGRPNPITGEIVAAKITPLVPEDPDALRRRIRQLCHTRLERYKVPAVIDVIVEDHYGARFKKARTSVAR